MKIHRTSLQLHNVLHTIKRGKRFEWYAISLSMHDFLVENELYATGPTLFTAVETTEKDVFDYNVYLPLNTVVTLPENSVFSFMETFHIMDGLMMRHCDVEDPLEPSNYLLKACADQNHLQLDEPFINIFLDVYGDGVIEIFAPIKQVSK